MELSILIPSRSEIFLAKTIENILENVEADTEVIAVLDGEWTEPSIMQNEKVNVIYSPVQLGQRGATNLACRLAKGKYVMKVDAHCSFDKGFDRKMIEAFKETGDNVTMVPGMYNLWGFDWECKKCGWRRYQGRTPEICSECQATEFERKIEWKVFAEKGTTGYKNWKGRQIEITYAPFNTSYCFTSEPHFSYFSEYRKRPEYLESLAKTGLVETMSIQGSCFMLTREKYWELNICDEELGNWGNQGIEVACKTWLSGGRVLVNTKTWYGHMFRTQGGDFSFPWGYSVKDVHLTKEKTKDLFFKNQWPKAIYPLSWLIEKFWPVRGWKDEDLNNLKLNS